MKIKDIRQFRSLYKTDIREIDSSNRNEHYVGVRTEVNGKSEYGFFEIYHGDKEGFNESDGIRGFLEGFLDMAKDGQAVYEFMQNAVDAKSTNFCLFWGKDEIDGCNYLLVVNNGEMFDMNSIRSILNVGVSTKSATNYQIGKFGIGFKLAHRLVGKENGLDELIYENYGPILFSWGNNELQDLKNLKENPETTPVKQDYEVYSEKAKRKAIIKTSEPWFFKILITNFPCQPENQTEPELIYDSQYELKQNAFSKEELKVLGRWMQKYSSYFDKHFRNGSLFFIRLGQGKQSHLEEENLAEGVKFSLAILNKIAKESLNHDGLNNVVLRGEILNPVDLEFEHFKISKTENNKEYRTLRFGKSENLNDIELAKESADKDIEILLGYTDYKHSKETFLNAPNLYLYFPLSEEKHRLRFILHSNAFYKSSSRTYLQKGSVGEEGINERLFKVFAEMLSKRMISWASSDKKSTKLKFLDLYANLLLSDESENPERVWINEPLWKPLLKFISSNIPVKDVIKGSFKLEPTYNKVRIKDTVIPVDTEKWLESQFNWFYWDSDEIYLSLEATNKLKIEKFTIIDLLHHDKIFEKLNSWLSRTKHVGVENILNELNGYFTASIKMPDTFWDNVGKLKIWEFNDGFYSLEEIGEEANYSSHLILFETLDSIKAQLQKAGWSLSKHSLTEYPNLFPSIQLRFQSIIKYIRNNDELIRTLNTRLSNAELSKDEKLNIVRTLAKKLSDDRENRISKLRELKVFKSEAGVVIPLKSLVKGTQIAWLMPFVINKKDYDTILDEYLTSTPSGIYEDIICPFWDDITQKITTDVSLISLYDYAKGVHTQNPKLNTLSGEKVIKVGNMFLKEGESFYYSEILSTFSESEYNSLKSALGKIGCPPIPDYLLLGYYKSSPFKINPKQFEISITQPISFVIEEAKAFLKLCSKEYSEIFNSFTIFTNAEDEVLISQKNDDINLIVSENVLIVNYIERYHSAIFLPFPNFLKEYSGTITLQGATLVNRLTDECDLANEEQLSSFVEIVLQSDITARSYFLDKIQGLEYNLDDEINATSSSVKLIRVIQSLNDENKAMGLIKKLATIQLESERIKLNEVHLFGNDEVIFEVGEDKFRLSFASIMINSDSKATKAVSKLVDILSNLELSDKAVLEKLFGLSGHVEKSVIANHLVENYKEESLKNAHQLAFVLHFSLLMKKTYTSEIFSVETNEGKLALKEIVLYSPENANGFIPTKNILTEQYDGVFELLAKNAFLYRGASSVFVCKLPFIENNKFFIPGITKIEIQSHQEMCFRLLFDKWIEAKIGQENLYLQPEKKWENIIGFDPLLTIVGDEFTVESERLPLYVSKWLNEAEPHNSQKIKYDFLRSLGVSLSGADILKVRKYLLGLESVEPDINYSLPVMLIVNTLKVLAQNNISMFLESSQAKFARSLYHRLPENTELDKIPLPIISQNRRDSLEFFRLEKGLIIDSLNLTFLRNTGYDIRNLRDDAALPVIVSELLRPTSKFPAAFTKAQFTFHEVNLDIITISGKEWAREFYLEWKKLYPQFQIITYPGFIPRIVKLNEKKIHDFEAGEIAMEGFKIIVNHERNEKSVIGLIEKESLLATDALEKLKQLYLEYDESIQDFLNRVQSDEKLRKEWEELRRKEREEQKKRQLSEEFGKSQKYSMAWFMNLLELMVISGGGKDLSNPEGNIVFSKVTFDKKDLRVISFSDPSKSISPSIELFTDFKATFSYFDKEGIRKNKEIQINGVTKKGHEVLAIPANVSELEAINLDSILSVELRFIRILDLINKLKNAFEKLEFEDSYNLKGELTDNIKFVFGPPGTGKTTRIANTIIEKIRKNESKRILVLTPTNKAADVLATRILDLCSDNDYPDSWLIRYGASTNIDLLDREIVYDSSTLKFHLYEKGVVISTIHRFPYEKIITGVSPLGDEKTGLNEISWDCIIFDESSMIMLPAIVYPLFKRKYKDRNESVLTEFVIGGDPLQIPPIFDLPDEDLPEGQEDVKEENIYKMVGLKSFKKDEQLKMERFGDKIENLTIQYRSIEVIGRLFSKFQYHDILEHGRSKGLGGNSFPRPLPDYFIKLGFKPITIIRYPVNKSDTIYDPQKLNGSPLQLYSSFLISELIRKFREVVQENWDLGVISPYRSQATLLNKLIDNQKDKSKVIVTTDTVHGFQGDQCDMVFTVFNPSSAKSQYSYFLKKEFIINVAISRAKDYLILLLPDKDTEGFDNLKFFHEKFSGSLLNIVKSLPKEMISYLNAKDLEKNLLGKPDFFLNNSFTNVHQNVNIYSDLIRDYIVRVSGNALDIHIKPS